MSKNIESFKQKQVKVTDIWWHPYQSQAWSVYMHAFQLNDFSLVNFCQVISGLFPCIRWYPISVTCSTDLHQVSEKMLKQPIFLRRGQWILYIGLFKCIHYHCFCIQRRFSKGLHKGSDSCRHLRISLFFWVCCNRKERQDYRSLRYHT